MNIKKLDIMIFSTRHPVLGKKIYDSRDLKVIILGWSQIVITSFLVYFASTYFKAYCNSFFYAILFLLTFTGSLAFASGILRCTYKWRFIVYEKGLPILTFNPEGNNLDGSYCIEGPIHRYVIPFKRIKGIYVHHDGGQSGIRLDLGFNGKNRIVADLNVYNFLGNYCYKRNIIIIQTLKKAMGEQWKIKYKETDQLWKGKKPGTPNNYPVYKWMNNSDIYN